jgi:hypothetical protein
MGRWWRRGTGRWEIFGWTWRQDSGDLCRNKEWSWY